MQKSKDVYEDITQKIISQLEQGVLPWWQPWNSADAAPGLPLRWNDEPYSGINIITLWSEAADKNYVSRYWMTFKQATGMKASVRKGEKAMYVVYTGKKDVVVEKEDETQTKQVSFLKSYPVFNACQIEGLPPAYYAVKEKIGNDNQRIAEIEAFFAATKADIRTGTKACYKSASDHIEMPPLESFIDTPVYYSILAHELTHWTKHPSRLNRDFGKTKWGNEAYAKEELVAEIGSCFLAADLGLEPETRNEHAAYISSWLEVLKNDKRFIVMAASHAQKAVDYIHSLQVVPSPA